MNPEASPSQPGGELEAGWVGRPHGLDGSFHVTRPRSGLLTVGTGVTVAGRTAAIVRRAGTEQHPIVRLEGVENRSAAELLRGQPLIVEGDQLPALAEGEWWAHELEGCEVFGGERLLGTVSRLLELPSCEALEVRREEGEPVLVPMVKDAVRRIEAPERRIEVDPEFLGLDEPSAPEKDGAEGGHRP
jgi:16S rRNA processing protein RimM